VLAGARHTTLRRVTRFYAAFALVALCAAVAACDGENTGSQTSDTVAATSDEPGRTNVLLITLDTVRTDALGVYGQSRVVTPHIDAFAAEGVLFEDCVSSSPSTLPSHASMFTGRHPYAHGVRANASYELPDAEVTLAEVLRSHGYQTRAEIASEVMAARTHLDQGFETFHGVDADDVQLQNVRISDGEHWVSHLELGG
jgi:arylsulfatase A-like enzyme